MLGLFAGNMGGGSLGAPGEGSRQAEGNERKSSWAGRSVGAVLGRSCSSPLRLETYYPRDPLCLKGPGAAPPTGIFGCLFRGPGQNYVASNAFPLGALELIWFCWLGAASQLPPGAKYGNRRVTGALKPLVPLPPSPLPSSAQLLPSQTVTGALDQL